VPVGEDQTQHLELARDISERFNRLFGPLFPKPQNSNDVIAPTCQRVMSLQDAANKMSKSDKSKLACINLIDDPEMIRVKIRKAKTDSLGQITYEPENRPELANLLRICLNSGSLSVVPLWVSSCDLRLSTRAVSSGIEIFEKPKVSS